MILDLLRCSYFGTGSGHFFVVARSRFVFSLLSRHWSSLEIAYIRSLKSVNLLCLAMLAAATHHDLGAERN